MTRVRHATEADVEGCVGILAGLLDHFTPDTHDEVRLALPRHRAWVAVADAGSEDPIGFALVERRHERAAEITFAAVAAGHRGRGVGRVLVAAVLEELAGDGVVAVEVKTLDASAGYQPYVATRAFWERCGFVQIDCIDPLPGWQPGNPSAIYVAALARTV